MLTRQALKISLSTLGSPIYRNPFTGALAFLTYEVRTKSIVNNAARFKVESPAALWVAPSFGGQLRKLKEFAGGSGEFWSIGWTKHREFLVCQVAYTVGSNACRDLQAVRATDGATRAVYDGPSLAVALDDAGGVILVLTPDRVLRFDAVSLQSSVALVWDKPCTDTRLVPALEWSESEQVFVGRRCGITFTVDANNMARLLPRAQGQ